MMMSGCVIMVNAFRFQTDAIAILIVRMMYRMNVIALVSFHNSIIFCPHVEYEHFVYHVVFFCMRLVSIYCMRWDWDSFRSFCLGQRVVDRILVIIIYNEMNQTEIIFGR